mmetsp:Transcript_4466/g.10812  ORF Transcript_4466/g.10812 Transcript_4466/m.10812 type:complete len:654 (-) Transcript_4466:616-2577(-)
MTITTNNVSSPLRYGSNVKLVAQREFGRSPEEVARKLHLTRDMAARLAVEDVLMGHHGCVNRLAWNQEGDRLASASDDRNVILWHYPDSGRLPVLVETDHQANIFGVRVLPETGDGMIVTGAMDFLVQLHTLDARGAPPCGGRRRSASGSFASAPCSTKSFACHRSRVKDVEVQPHNPHMFWSASEDGTVRQFDTRCGDQGRFQSPNVLLGVRGRSRKVPLKGLSLNKSRPYQLAVACGDPFVRIFDMRKLSARAPCEDMFAQPLLQLAPPHLHRASSLQAACYATCAKFSSRGDKVVATYHGDHAYSFDITGDPASYGTSFVQHSACAALAGAGARPSREWERWKFKGNTAMFEKDFHGAILNYSAGLRTEPTSTALLIGRASAYMQRQWAGDAAYAVLDCEAAMSLNPDLPRAHILRAQALLSLRHLRLAMRAVNTIAAKFPEQHQEEVEKLRSSISDEEKARKTLHEQRIAMRSHTRQRRMRSTPGLQHESGLGTGAEAEAEGLSPFTSGHASASSVAGHLNGEEAARGSVLMGLDTDESDAEPTESDSDDADMVGERELEGASTSGCDGSGNKDEPLPSIWELSQGTRRLMMRWGVGPLMPPLPDPDFRFEPPHPPSCLQLRGALQLPDRHQGSILPRPKRRARCLWQR